uniref:Ankyrin repeat protein n=1 Tax=Odontella aurita TaxID=265563 RepID=A0A7S4MYG9_9STRA|mmetsp:Transcript_40176/g.121092  ORF Transcript_40176/g.121092 Transcript_40176/m.121092 type:complete len:454 (+) Transcript_40176:31-1392(+)
MSGSGSQYESSSPPNQSNGADADGGANGLWSLLRTGIDHDVVDPVDWDAVRRRIASHPGDLARPLGRPCSAGGRNFALVMHDLCRRDPLKSENYDDVPLDVMRSAIAAYPEALQTRTCDCGRCQDNVLPLHLACDFSRDVERVTEVLEAYPAAAASPSPGGIPLLVYIESAWVPNLDLVRVLLRAYPEGARRDSSGHCPLAEIFEAWDISMEADKIYFECAMELIRARYDLDHAPLVAVEFLPLHAAMNSVNLRAFTRANSHARKYFMSRLATGCTEKDQNRNLPIHLLLRSVPEETWEGSEEQFWIMKNMMVSAMLTICSPLLLARIAATPDETGTLPLHLAVRNGHNLRELNDTEDSQSKSVLGLMISAAPKAVETRDIATHFYPFMIAAVDDACDIGSIYELLRMSPMMAWGLGNCPSQADTANESESIPKERSNGGHEKCSRPQKRFKV